MVLLFLEIKEAWAVMPRLYVKVVGLPFAKWWNKTAPRLMTWRHFCHLLRSVISFRRFSHTSRGHNVSC